MRAMAAISRWRFGPLFMVVLAAGVVALAVIRAAVLIAVPLDGCNPHLALQFLGEATCEGASLDDLRESLVRDCGFALVYFPFLTFLALALPPRTHTDVRLDPLNTIALLGPVVAATADIAENFVLMSSTTVEGNSFLVQGPRAADLVSALALLKWTALVVVVVVLLLRIANHSPDRLPPASLTRTGDPPEASIEELALCCSGGGIRSAAFSLGVLFELEKKKEITDELGMIAAVSGGNYAATGWCLAKANGADRPAETVIRGLIENENLFADEPSVLGESAVRTRAAIGKHRYLANGPGGLPRAVLWAGAAVASNILQLMAVLVLVGWPLGKLLTTEALYPKLATVLEERGPFAAAESDWRPLLYLAALGVGLAFLAALFGPRIRRALLSGAAGLLGIVALYALVLIVFPWLLVQAYGAGRAQAFYVGGISLLTVIGALARLFRDPLRRLAPRLGGVALGVFVLALLGLTVHDSVVEEGPFAPEWVWGVSAVACLLLAYGIDTQTWSVRELYRARLTNSFVPDPYLPRPVFARVGRSAATRPIGFTWEQLKSRNVPELHVCCAASRVGLQPNGSTAEAFSISQRHVRHYRATGTVTVDTSTYVQSLNSLALEMLKTPAGWLATSGAAFASAMGRAGLGSTNALLAAANVDLGVWVPTPAAVIEDGGTIRTRFPPVGLGRLTNEIFGLYSERDEMIFVSDGGHVENLGLVELLRNGARNIVCIDASGDEPGSFATFRAALRHADAVLPSDPRLVFDTKPLDESPKPPAVAVYEIPINEKCYGTIFYAKLQAAQDQSLNLRQFANSDPRFPNYSTANQLLDDQQFRFLVLAGRHAGRGLVERLEAR